MDKKEKANFPVVEFLSLVRRYGVLEKLHHSDFGIHCQRI